MPPVLAAPGVLDHIEEPDRADGQRRAVWPYRTPQLTLDDARVFRAGRVRQAYVWDARVVAQRVGTEHAADGGPDPFAEHRERLTGQVQIEIHKDPGCARELWAPNRRWQ
ncbi:hypothetical protein GCM10022255_085310 [Dactylosporangium darangshiense]|uniref:Uncharacterized protein n=1 Tax=Dactylosporangium darangshiense TaxID=579108 RepID=A0ABP8DMK5_9ACTN